MEESATFDRHVIDYIQHAAATGLYEIRGLGAKRRVPHFDDLVFLGASLSRYALEGYRETCPSRTVLGTRFAEKPIELDIPLMVTGMSYGALSRPAKTALRTTRLNHRARRTAPAATYRAAAISRSPARTAPSTTPGASTSRSSTARSTGPRPTKSTRV